MRLAGPPSEIHPGGGPRCSRPRRGPACPSSVRHFAPRAGFRPSSRENCEITGTERCTWKCGVSGRRSTWMSIGPSRGWPRAPSRAYSPARAIGRRMRRRSSTSLRYGFRTVRTACASRRGRRTISVSVRAFHPCAIRPLARLPVRSTPTSPSVWARQSARRPASRASALCSVRASTSSAALCAEGISSTLAKIRCSPASWGRRWSAASSRAASLRA